MEYKSVKVPIDVWKKLKQEALNRETSISKVIEELLNGLS